MESNEIYLRYQAAINSFIEKIKTDQNIIAIIIAGSLAYDTVWNKSDIDMVIIVRDQEIATRSYCIDEDDIVLNGTIILRSELKRFLEKQSGGSLSHSIMAKGKIIYSIDDSLYAYFAEFQKIGNKDMENTIFFFCNQLIGTMHKIQKWIEVKSNLSYARFYMLKASEIIAKIEVCRHLTIPTREAILQAELINSKLIHKFYYQPLNKDLSKEELLNLIDDIDDFIMSNIAAIKNVVLELLGDGEIKTMTQISRYYHMETHYIIDIFEYLNEKGLIEKISQTIRITPKSKMQIEEVAFLYIGD